MTALDRAEQALDAELDRGDITPAQYARALREFYRAHEAGQQEDAP